MRVCSDHGRAIEGEIQRSQPCARNVQSRPRNPCLSHRDRVFEAPHSRIANPSHHVGDAIEVLELTKLAKHLEREQIAERTVRAPLKGTRRRLSERTL